KGEGRREKGRTLELRRTECFSLLPFPFSLDTEGPFINLLEPRRPDPRVGAAPAPLEIGLDLVARLALCFQGELQTDERPSVVRMLFEVVAIHAFSIGRTFRVEQRSSKPVGRGKGQRLGAVGLGVL